MSENMAFAEAPASWTVRYRTPDGFDAMLTLRAKSGRDVLERAESAMKWLREKGYIPQAGGLSPKGDNGEGASQEAPMCPTHQKPMKRSQHGGWYCPAKIADDDGTGKPVYCKQKVK